MDVGFNGGGIAFNNGAIGNCDCCGCPYPMVDVTLTWTDSDTTKTYLDNEFTNGETIAICPSNYTCLVDTNYLTYATQKLEEWEWVGLGTHGDRSTVLKSGPIGSPYTFTTTAQKGTGNTQLSLRANRVNITDTAMSAEDRNQQSIRMGIGPVTANTDEAEAYYLRFLADYSSTSDFGAVYYYKHQGTTPSRPQTRAVIGISDGFNKSYTTAKGITVTWAKNTEAANPTWGDCF